MSDKIARRPWRVVGEPDRRGDWLGSIYADDAEDEWCHATEAICPLNQATADLIVRLVNAEPEIVAALEDAVGSLSHLRLLSEDTPRAAQCAIVAGRSIEIVRAALEKVRP